jgi:cell division initiation protein
MMDLTPLDVRKKREDLKRVVRGYDQAQVDAFLDMVGDRLEELVQEEVRLSEQVTMLREQLKGFQDREKALNEALIAAQELREEARSQADKAADFRIQEAGQEAERMIEDARRAVESSQRSLDALHTQRASFLRGLRSMAERFLQDVSYEEERLEAGVMGRDSEGDDSDDQEGEPE